MKNVLPSPRLNRRGKPARTESVVPTARATAKPKKAAPKKAPTPTADVTAPTMTADNHDDENVANALKTNKFSNLKDTPILLKLKDKAKKDKPTRFRKEKHFLADLGLTSRGGTTDRSSLFSPPLAAKPPSQKPVETDMAKDSTKETETEPETDVTKDSTKETEPPVPGPDAAKADMAPKPSKTTQAPKTTKAPPAASKPAPVATTAATAPASPGPSRRSGRNVKKPELYSDTSALNKAGTKDGKTPRKSNKKKDIV